MLPTRPCCAEQCVLGGLLLDNSARARLNGLSGEHFSVERHRTIYEAILDQIEDGEEGAADAVTVWQRLQRAGKADEAGGLAYLNISPRRGRLLKHAAGDMRSKVSASSAGLASVLPVTRRLRLRRVQDRVAASHERIEAVRLGLGPLDPLLLLERELAVVACPILDGGNEFAQAVRALQPARVAEQGAQLATFLVARAYFCFVSGARLLVGALSALLFFLLGALRFGQADDGRDDALQARLDEAALRVVPIP